MAGASDSAVCAQEAEGSCPSPRCCGRTAWQQSKVLPAAGTVQYDEESRARLCDSGLPDPDVCDVLPVPPRDSQVVSEAWSRGRAPPACVGHKQNLLNSKARFSPHAGRCVSACVRHQWRSLFEGGALQRLNHRTYACACKPFGQARIRGRRRWLLGLLVLQSMSSFVLDSYQELLRNHLVVTLFLTMLVGET
jgi:hypothetical protein